VMKSVGLAGCELGVDGAKAVVDYVSGSASITSFDVGYNQIDQEQALNLLSVFKQKDVMKSVGLAGCELGVDGAKAVADYISVSASISSVNVLSNKLDEDSAELLLRVKAEKPHLRTLCGLTHEETKLDLSGKGLGPADGKLLAPEISVSASVTHIDVRYNSIVGDGASELSAAVLSSTNIEVFNEVPVKEMRAGTFTELDLKGKAIGIVGSMVVAGLLPIMDSVTSLNLAGNSICETIYVNVSDVQGSSFNEGDNVIYHGRELVISMGKDSDGDIRMFDPFGVKMLADSLAVNASVTRLNVRDNRMDEESKSALRNAIEGRSGFELLF